MSDEIKNMFSTIADKYDRMNHIMSMGKDMGWRRSAAIECLIGPDTLNVLDVATGTGDLALTIIWEGEKRDKKISITGVDFNKDMLRVAKSKIKKENINNIRLIMGDALSLQLKSGSFDVVTSGFALRNFDSLKSFIEESYRVLKPGGKIVYLDVARPDTALTKLFQFYYFKIVPVIVTSVDYNPNAYQYLFSSLWIFDKHKALELVKHAGFKDAKIKNLTFGAAFLITARKPARKAKR
jgi:demethylmenaquinone methyltransferase / 2-methoxy-6-polyprenyl-1,4-benzoquinol methylase